MTTPSKASARMTPAAPPPTTDAQTSDVPPAVVRAANALRPDVPHLYHGPLGTYTTARAALTAALSGRVLGADEMHTEASAALFGGPDVKTPHMPKREGETYMDWCDRVAAVAVDAIRAAILGADQ